MGIHLKQELPKANQTAGTGILRQLRNTASAFNLLPS